MNLNLLSFLKPWEEIYTNLFKGQQKYFKSLLHLKPDEEAATEDAD